MTPRNKVQFSQYSLTVDLHSFDSWHLNLVIMDRYYGAFLKGPYRGISLTDCSVYQAHNSI